ncbi:MAG: TAXI family TRAP transporter solute-binding subunit [Pseudomonadales bacterium]|jgi:TRAP transporter TAXI family solute receptor|nr:TAXI family TRAP transporter solute-binding subunit [Pseudomonadales bacterium]MDP6471391.1 TAXI family TRAP transporter solute-binding subunit [Pseudomonadales bacterium]MDP6826417.1 TAXI family TRAP transporter solute-binding subunit [Pseudomonadales bacterium]MDP6970970.1 TAXI family TRAP transporter solute-binding subunit [Pseudomonadales bacterium]|tara:strand:- start:317 stop:1465 length:1149 start_codon:yes stop_codon:yes gene_type:complete
MQRLLATMMLVAALLVTELGNAVQGQLPRMMAWSAYNLGTTGYNQAVAIGKVLKQNYGVTLRVLPAKNDVSRLMPLVKGRVQLSANGVATYFAQEGVFQFARRAWGPLPLRLVFTSNGDSNQSLAVAADTGVTTLAGLRGRRVPWVRGAPALNVSTEAMLACAGLTWDDVKRVDFPGYNAMWNGVVNDQVDAAYATTVSGPTRKLEASPRGIFWPPLRHEDEGCWARLRELAPYMTQHVGTRGAGISKAVPHEGGTYPYPLLIGLDRTPADLVYATAAAIVKHYDEYKNADPGAIGWAVERQVRQWVVPWHEGAVRLLRELDAWSDADQAHNERLLHRQLILKQTWDAFVAINHSEGDIFERAWRAKRVEALEAAGMDPVWR